MVIVCIAKSIYSMVSLDLWSLNVSELCGSAAEMGAVACLLQEPPIVYLVSCSCWILVSCEQLFHVRL